MRKAELKGQFTDHEDIATRLGWVSNVIKCIAFLLMDDGNDAEAREGIIYMLEMLSDDIKSMSAAEEDYVKALLATKQK